MTGAVTNGPKLREKQDKVRILVFMEPRMQRGNISYKNEEKVTFRASYHVLVHFGDGVYSELIGAEPKDRNLYKVRICTK